jgi:DNA-binding response OmpR family regulator
MRVLVIEDEAKVASFISKGLEEEAYEVEVVYNGRDGLDRLTADRYDIVLLDLMIPEISGLEVLKTIRERGVNTPVLIITAKSSKEDVVRGLDTGSDDYLTKPFSFDELLARIRALLRRDAARNTPVIRYKGLMLNPFDRTLAVGAQVRRSS